MPFQKGNRANPGGRNGRPVQRALAMELKAAGDDQKALRKIMRTVIDKAEEGEPWAVQFIADRLDGKPVQQIDQNINDSRDMENHNDMVTRALELQAIAVEVKPLPSPTHDVGEDKQ